LIGTPAEVCEQLQADAGTGVTHPLFALPQPFDRTVMELFAREVALAFR
jgi:hypothetical protein